MVLTLTSTSKYDNSISKYMSEYVKSTDYKEETINNAKWYTESLGTNNSYSTASKEYFYNVKISNKKSGEVCSKLDEMVKKTLYIVEK